jgi:hypothetical protein
VTSGNYPVQLLGTDDFRRGIDGSEENGVIRNQKLGGVGRLQGRRTPPDWGASKEAAEAAKRRTRQASTKSLNQFLKSLKSRL